MTFQNRQVERGVQLHREGGVEWDRVAVNAEAPVDRCKICQQPFPFAEGPCPVCRTIHCPICGAATHVFIAERHTRCKHVIGMACLDERDEDAGGWEHSPFVRWNIPVPEPSQGFDWMDTSRLVDAFGMLLPLLNAYEDDGVDTVQLFDLLLERVVVPVYRTSWHVGTSTAVPKYSGTDYFTADPDEVRNQVTALVAHLRSGFKRFASDTH